jgi:hypothetical protein
MNYDLILTTWILTLKPFETWNPIGIIVNRKKNSDPYFSLDI